MILLGERLDKLENTKSQQIMILEIYIKNRNIKFHNSLSYTNVHGLFPINLYKFQTNYSANMKITSIL